MGWMDYIKASPDLLKAFNTSGQTADVWGQQHYTNWGSTEGRRGVPVAQQYLDRNPDVATWADTTDAPNLDDALAHFAQHGSREGRAWDPVATAPAPAPTAEPTFDIPTDAYPQSNQGINWEQNELMTRLLDELTGKVSTMEADIAASADKSNEYYGQLIEKALGPKGFRGTLNNLTNRNVLRSSEASNALSRTASNLVEDKLLNSYLGNINTLNRKTEIPERLGNLAQLGAESTSTDKGRLYELLAKILMNQ